LTVARVDRRMDGPGAAAAHSTAGRSS
jgi:hypothetical protein